MIKRNTELNQEALKMFAAKNKPPEVTTPLPNQVPEEMAKMEQIQE